MKLYINLSPSNALKAEWDEKAKKKNGWIGYLQSCWVISEPLWRGWHYSTVVFWGGREHFLDAANKILSILAMWNRVPWVGLWKCSQVQYTNNKYVRRCPYITSVKATYFSNYLGIKGDSFLITSEDHRLSSFLRGTMWTWVCNKIPVNKTWLTDSQCCIASTPSVPNYMAFWLF
jgi:hypothetical protein